MKWNLGVLITFALLPTALQLHSDANLLATTFTALTRSISSLSAANNMICSSVITRAFVSTRQSVLATVRA